MGEYRFDGRVAVVTGAGRGLGKAYAQLLASRGASVVVNDLGAELDGTGSDTVPANDVTAEIVSAGGKAIADCNDVSTASGAEALIETATHEYGRIDILVNNAGNNSPAAFPDADLDNLNKHMSVHLLGSYYTARRAWPHMVEQGYGRIVMTTSTNIFGTSTHLAYPTVKAAVIGMSRHISIAGAPHDIKINLVAPAAHTRLITGRRPFVSREGPVENPAMSPDLVAPMVAYLSHETCPVSGEIYGAGAGRFTRIFLASNDGYLQTDPPPSTEDVAEHWAEINDETGYYVPADMTEWLSRFLGHVRL
jgi:NAD(P)-dependent dehydrogenase (short-subunit alcohol dehydrogenase family)